ncbi:MAG: aldehyde dehydrogenase family protein [Verrucomicrobia bacterium]|nr:aldehyde dehydrogenase family protein [Verrucomicrobiota bacterium]MBV8376690.1 aldehyde dehydrogenase family protein [Verrucomicrobiota bacterium]
MVQSSSSTDVGSVKSEIFPLLGLTDSLPGAFSGEWFGRGTLLEKRSPIDGTFLARIAQATEQDYERAIAGAHRAFLHWRTTPAPKRGEVVRRLSERLRDLKVPLGRLVSLEAGKILAEGEGEVQEMIDVCDFALGLSRQLYGLTIASERENHRMLEQWHPLGLVGIISAFNFPVAVWSWNSALAVVCGNATLWKPSEKTPISAIACIRIAEQVCRECSVDPGLWSLAVSDSSIGRRLAEDRRVPLVSATGSTQMGRTVSETVARRLGRTLLELGGNNAIIVTSSANLRLATRALLFGAVGTAGQRCTSTRRVIVHESVKEPLVESLRAAYGQVSIGNPLHPETLMGPLIDAEAVNKMGATLAELKVLGGRILSGGEHLSGPEYPGGLYVTPCLAEANNEWPVVQRETFAPILYILPYRELEEAIALHNAVPQGLSSAIFSTDLSETEQFLSAVGSDCGIANVNVGTSGAEIGGAFGGEKETGGGRESGSDAWKNYMRRQTVTINYGSELPLAQGIRFE